MEATNHQPSFYGKVLGDALAISWKHKHLWWFGIFTIFLRYGNPIDTAFAVFTAIFRGSWSMPLVDRLNNYIPALGTLVSIAKFSPYPILTSIIFYSLVLLMLALLVLVAVVGVGGLVGSIRKIELGSDTEFHTSLELGIKNLKHTSDILLVSLVTQIVFLTLAAVIRAVVGRPTNLALWLVLVAAFILLGLAAVTANMVVVYAVNDSVARQRGLVTSLVAGWEIVKTHWLVSLEMSVLSALVTLAIGVAGILILLIASVPIVFFCVLLLALGAASAFNAMLVITLILWVLGLILMLAIIGTFLGAVWSLLWVEFEKGTPVAHLIRWAQKISDARKK